METGLPMILCVSPQRWNNAKETAAGIPEASLMGGVHAKIALRLCQILNLDIFDWGIEELWEGRPPEADRQGAEGRA